MPGVSIHDQQYTLTIQTGGTIRIEREGFGQTITAEALQRHQWNSVADACRLIEGQILGRWTKPA